MTDEQKALTIIEALDEYGRECDSYEYGLPTYNTHMQDMIDIVIKILSNTEVT